MIKLPYVEAAKREVFPHASSQEKSPFEDRKRGTEGHRAFKGQLQARCLLLHSVESGQLMRRSSLRHREERSCVQNVLVSSASFHKRQSPSVERVPGIVHRAVKCSLGVSFGRRVLVQGVGNIDLVRGGGLIDRHGDEEILTERELRKGFTVASDGVTDEEKTAEVTGDGVTNEATGSGKDALRVGQTGRGREGEGKPEGGGRIKSCNRITGAIHDDPRGARRRVFCPQRRGCRTGGDDRIPELADASELRYAVYREARKHLYQKIGRHIVYASRRLPREIFVFIHDSGNVSK